jgi:pyrimidine operon attenuation protein/uracil phosphoribosyltransferase
MPSNLENTTVILVDDVLFTGRTIRAALDAVLDYGRPRRVELAVLVDRGGRELPIQPDYLVRKIQIAPDERIDVLDRTDGVSAIVQPVGVPTGPPPP